MLCLATQYFEITYIKFEVKTPVLNSQSTPFPPELLHGSCVFSPRLNSFCLPAVTFA